MIENNRNKDDIETHNIIYSHMVVRPKPPQSPPNSFNSIRTDRAVTPNAKLAMGSKWFKNREARTIADETPLVFYNFNLTHETMPESLAGHDPLHLPPNREHRVDGLSKSRKNFNQAHHLSTSPRSTTPECKTRNLKNQSSSPVIINLAYSKYRIFHEVGAILGWKVSQSKELELKNEPWDVLWSDSGQGIEKIIRQMKTYQRINHFPGMVHIYRKDLLAKSMCRMRKLIGKREYGYTPTTWFLPKEHSDVESYLRVVKNACVIMKPSSGAQGRGIMLATRPEHLVTCHEPYVIQSYLTNPLLIEGFKFDMRIYVLVVSCEPLRILLFRNGLCRLCTVPYSRPADDNLENSFMHLTNYSINKHNMDHFVQNNSYQSNNASHSIHGDEYGSKRSIAWLRIWLERQGVAFDPIWREIAHIIVKTVLAILPILQQNVDNCKIDGQNVNPFTCFELLGFDIILTNRLEPILLEVNHMPSFSTDSALDKSIKTALIAQSLKLLNVSQKERQQYQLNMAIQSQLRLYGDIFDENDRKLYGSAAMSKLPLSSSNAHFHKGSSDDEIADERRRKKEHPSKQCKSNGKKKFQFSSRKMYWDSYLRNESKYMNNKDCVDRSYQNSPFRNHDCFDVIYPVGIYRNQPNAVYSSTYENIIQLLFDVTSTYSIMEDENEESDIYISTGLRNNRCCQPAVDNSILQPKLQHRPKQQSDEVIVSLRNNRFVNSSDGYGTIALRNLERCTADNVIDIPRNSSKKEKDSPTTLVALESEVQKEELNVVDEMRRATNGISETLARLGIQVLPYHHHGDFYHDNKLKLNYDSSFQQLEHGSNDIGNLNMDVNEKYYIHRESNNVNFPSAMHVEDGRLFDDVKIIDTGIDSRFATDLEQFLREENRIFQLNRSKTQASSFSISAGQVHQDNIERHSGQAQTSETNDRRVEREILLENNSHPFSIETAGPPLPFTTQYQRFQDLQRIAHNDHDVSDGPSSMLVNQYTEYRNQYLQNVQDSRQAKHKHVLPG